MVACRGSSTQPVAEPASPTPTPAVVGVESAKATAQRPHVQRVPLQGEPHHNAMREVSLSPSGDAALTFARDGRVRLWPSFQLETVPWRLPLSAPAWMSLAAIDGGYRVAVVDTAGGTHVGRVEVTDEGAFWVEEFDRPPRDPMFEVHVLPGGDRILALGIDHRIRLWDAAGNVLATLDEYGVIPWQLRVETEPSGAVHLAAVMFGPTRMQRLSIEGDRIALQGDAVTLAIDQSPNRNDAGMSADGRYATAMQKPRRFKPRIEIEVVDLHDGSRRMLAFDSDANRRPRVHPQADAVLVETGSGAVWKLPLSAAVPWTPGEDRASVPVVTPVRVNLAGSNEAWMMHSTARAGVHAAAFGRTLYVQPLGGEAKGLQTGTRFYPKAAALDADGSTVAWGTKDALFVEPVSATTPARRLAPTADDPALLAFVGDQLLAMDEYGLLQLRDRASDAVVARAGVRVDGHVQQAAWRPEPGGGTVIVASSASYAKLRVVPVRDGAFGTVVEVPDADRTQWPEGGPPNGVEPLAWLGSLGLDPSGWQLRNRWVRTMVPHSGGTRWVVIQKPDFGGSLTVADAAGGRSWVEPIDRWHQIAWSEDGTRLVVTGGEGGGVYDAATGKVVLLRFMTPPEAKP